MARQEKAEEEGDAEEEDANEEEEADKEEDTSEEEEDNVDKEEDEEKHVDQEEENTVMDYLLLVHFKVSCCITVLIIYFLMCKYLDYFLLYNYFLSTSVTISYPLSVVPLLL